MGPTDSRIKKMDVYSAISDPTRRTMLKRLAADREMHVSELMEPFSISQPGVSKHLRVLREAGLVTSRKQGRHRLYSINAERLREVHDWVSHFEKYWDAKLDALGDYLDRQGRRKSTEKKKRP